MAKNIDWDAVEKEAMSKAFKEYAPEGTYKTKVEGVDGVSSSNGNKGIRFTFKETPEYKFSQYGISRFFKKENFRIHHMKELFVLFGLTEDQARKAVAQCEDATDVMDAYVEAFKKFVPKMKEVEVVVFFREQDDQYPYGFDFASEKVRMNHPGKKAEKKEDVLADAVELSTEETDGLPF